VTDKVYSVGIVSRTGTPVTNVGVVPQASTKEYVQAVVQREASARDVAIAAAIAALVSGGAGALDTATSNAIANAVSAETTRATTAEALKLAKASNLADLTSATTARANLGLGSAATTSASAYATAAQGTKADAALAATNNLSDLALPSAARTNLGLGTAATTAASAYATAAQGTAADNALAKTSNLADVASVSAARTNLVVVGIQENVLALANSGAAVTVASPAAGSQYTILRYTLTANCTFTLPTAAAGLSFTIELVQDGTGSRTATFTAKWSGGVAPTLSTGAGKKDVLTFTCHDGANWYGFVAGLDMR